MIRSKIQNGKSRYSPWKKPVSDMFTKFVEGQIKGIKVVMEHEFAPERKWRLDYAILSHKIAIEVEGGVFKQTTYTTKAGKTITRVGGRHNTAQGFLNDITKYNHLACSGWILLRVIPSELMTMNTIEMINSVIESKMSNN